MNRYEKLIDNTRYLLNDFDKHDLGVWINLFIQEAIGLGLYMTVDDKPSDGLIVILAIFGLKDPNRVFAKQVGGHLTIYFNSNRGNPMVLCTFRLKNPLANPKTSLLKELEALGAPAGLFNIAKQVIMDMKVFYEMPG